jgi:hypothetical protein
MNDNRLPLPLELTKPVLLAGDLDSQYRAGLDKYDPKTQLCTGGGGGGGRGGGGKTRSNQQCSVQGGLLNGDVIQIDVQVDDVLVY